jgi:hypothetical protein
MLLLFFLRFCDLYVAMWVFVDMLHGCVDYFYLVRFVDDE